MDHYFPREPRFSTRLADAFNCSAPNAANGRDRLSSRWRMSGLRRRCNAYGGKLRRASIALNRGSWRRVSRHLSTLKLWNPGSASCSGLLQPSEAPPLYLPSRRRSARIHRTSDHPGEPCTSPFHAARRRRARARGRPGARHAAMVVIIERRSGRFAHRCPSAPCPLHRAGLRHFPPTAFGSETSASAARNSASASS